MRLVQWSLSLRAMLPALRWMSTDGGVRNNNKGGQNWVYMTPLMTVGGYFWLQVER